MTLSEDDRRGRGKVTVRHADGRVEVVDSGRFLRRRASAHQRAARLRALRAQQRDYARSWYLRTKHWEQARTQAKVRDGWACVGCGSCYKLEVHHLTYERVGVEWLEDLETRCSTCHDSEHDHFR